MDTCTNVPDMCRKEKQRVQREKEWQTPPKGDGTWKQGQPAQWGWGSLLFRTRVEGTVALRMTSIHLWAKKDFLSILWHPWFNKCKQQTANIFSTRASVPLKSVFTLWSEIVNMGLEMQFEDVVLVNVFRLWGDGDWVTQQRKAGQWIIILRTHTQKKL